MSDDAEKRINLMFDQLNNQEISAPAIQDLKDLVSGKFLITLALDKKDYSACQSAALTLMTKRFDASGLWISGIKRIVDGLERASKMGAIGQMNNGTLLSAATSTVVGEQQQFNSAYGNAQPNSYAQNQYGQPNQTQATFSPPPIPQQQKSYGPPPIPLQRGASFGDQPKNYGQPPVQQQQVLTTPSAPAPSTDFGNALYGSTPTRPNMQSFGPPPTNQRSFRPPPTNQQSFGPPPTNQQTFGPPPTQQQSLGPPPTMQQSFGPPPTNQQSFRPPPTNQQSFGPPPTQQQSLGPPPTNQQSFGPPHTQQQSFGPPPTQQQSFGPPPTNQRSQPQFAPIHRTPQASVGGIQRPLSASHQTMYGQPQLPVQPTNGSFENIAPLNIPSPYMPNSNISTRPPMQQAFRPQMPGFPTSGQGRQ